MHVFGPEDVFPGSATRAYTPIERGIALYEMVAEPLGFSRVVFVQPSAYGTDNSCMLATMRTHPARCRGVAVIEATTDEAKLLALHQAGVRGVRFNLVTEGAPDLKSIRAEIERMAARIRPLGWHLQLYAGLTFLANLVPLLRELGVPVVFDHMAGVLVANGPDQPGFETVLRMLADGACWVKLSGADRVSESSVDFHLAVPFARALVSANPARVVWGTDWPHLGHHTGPRGAAAMPAIYRDLDDHALLSVLRDAVPDVPTWHRVLRDNPAALYDF
jgi:predicted TIM-barrel fold metal-dependent hydrolase